MYRSHFVYPFFRWGILSCFYLLVTLLSVLLGTYTEVKLLGHMVILFLIFWGTTIPFSIAAALFHIPTNGAQGFPFLWSLPALAFSGFLVAAILMAVRWCSVSVLTSRPSPVLDVSPVAFTCVARVSPTLLSLSTSLIVSFDEWKFLFFCFLFAFGSS